MIPSDLFSIITQPWLIFISCNIIGLALTIRLCVKGSDPYIDWLHWVLGIVLSLGAYFIGKWLFGVLFGDKVTLIVEILLALFYIVTAYSIVAGSVLVWSYYEVKGRIKHEVENMFTPRWNRDVFYSKNHRKYQEKRSDKRWAKNKELVQNISNQKELIKVYREACVYEIRKLALSQITDSELLRNLIITAPFDKEVLFRYVNDSSLESAINKVDDIDVLVALIIKLEEKNALVVLKRLPVDVDEKKLVKILKNTKHRSVADQIFSLVKTNVDKLISDEEVLEYTRALAMTRCEKRSIIEKYALIKKFPLIQEVALKRCENQKVIADAILKGVAIKVVDDLLSKIIDQQILFELAMQSRLRSVALYAYKMVEEQSNRNKILIELSDVFELKDLKQFKVCPYCLGNLKLDVTTYEYERSGPGDSFFRERVSWTETSTSYRLYCTECAKVITKGDDD